MIKPNVAQESVSKTPDEIEEECTRSKGTDINMALGTEVSSPDAAPPSAQLLSIPADNMGLGLCSMQRPPLLLQGTLTRAVRPQKLVPPTGSSGEKM